MKWPKWMKRKMKEEPRFNTERPLADQIVESIVEYPEEWKAGAHGYRHKSGLYVWVTDYVGGVEVHSPICIQFTAEEKQLIFNVVQTHKVNAAAQKKKGNKKRAVALLNKSKEPWDADVIFACTAAGVFAVILLSPIIIAAFRTAQ